MATQAQEEEEMEEQPEIPEGDSLPNNLRNLRLLYALPDASRQLFEQRNKEPWSEEVENPNVNTPASGLGTLYGLAFICV